MGRESQAERGGIINIPEIRALASHGTANLHRARSGRSQCFQARWPLFQTSALEPPVFGCVAQKVTLQRRQEFKWCVWETIPGGAAGGGAGETGKRG